MYLVTLVSEYRKNPIKLLDKSHVEKSRIRDIIRNFLSIMICIYDRPKINTKQIKAENTNTIQSIREEKY